MYKKSIIHSCASHINGNKGNLKMITLKDFKNGSILPAPIYVVKPYVLLSDNGHGGEMVLLAGDADEMKKLGSYFDDVKIQIRQYDLHANDNTKVLN